MSAPTSAPTSAPARPVAAARAVAALLLLSAVAYTAWVLEVVLSTGLDPVQAYISELAAEDQPLGGLFRATDLVAGLAVLAAALLALSAFHLRRPVPREPGASPGRRPWAAGGWAALALFGAATAADSRLPLSCAPTSDEMCAARETAGLVPATHTAHAVTSSLAVLGALGGLTALTVAARRYHRWPPVRRYGPWLLGAEVLATGWSLGAIAAFEAGHGTWALGAGQRLQVLLVALWLALLAAGVGLPSRTGPSAGAAAEGVGRNARDAAAPSRTERRDPV
ncbi:hypothetical protein ADK60_33260 [Streptomyces sp. XY431]|uniref:DUF998 domain-containing protein n=1 Tax=Streptomyces sp. XY431 TaxID=1415562 RepID=UPI0006AED720|nr:DUF998 domain-containing protein [Streptomyces sp. XY431]KOV12088.1 hypothetical protein ADK60_33260 [Streptomyces sp. XY431]